MKADVFLDHHDIPYELIEQERETHNAYESAKERGLSERQIVKSVIISRSDDFMHCLLPGNRELDTEWFSDADMANEKEVLELTGFEPGSVHPFSSSCKHVVDRRLLACDKVSFTTGGRAEGIMMTVDAFKKGLEEFDLTVADCTVGQSPVVDRLEREYGLTRGVASSLVDKSCVGVFEDLAEHRPANAAADALLFLSRYCEGRAVSKEMLMVDDIVSVIGEQFDEQARRRLVALLEDEDDQSCSLAEVMDTVIKKNDEAVEDFRNGEDKALNFLVGQVMEATGGKVDPKKAREQIHERLT